MSLNSFPFIFIELFFKKAYLWFCMNCEIILHCIRNVIIIRLTISIMYSLIMPFLYLQISVVEENNFLSLYQSMYLSLSVQIYLPIKKNI